MSELIHGSGKIVYDPYRANMKRRTDHWCIVDVDKEITRYYRNWFLREKHIILEQPSWDAHISVIRGEPQVKRHPELWKKYHGERVDFTYVHGDYRSCPDEKNGGTYYWINIACPKLSHIRQEMGLPVGWHFHITFGRTYY